MDMYFIVYVYKFYIHILRPRRIIYNKKYNFCFKGTYILRNISDFPIIYVNILCDI